MSERDVIAACDAELTRLRAERDRLQAENAALAKELRHLLTACDMHGVRFLGLEGARAALAAHAARTQEGPR